MTLSLPIDPDANALLARNPLALLIGMLLDQQVPMERAFSAPFDLVRRLGHEPSAADLAGYDPEALTAVFRGPPALHRYPQSMAARVQDMCRVIAEDYDGEAARIWDEAADGEDLLARLRRLPGFGPQKAQIFVALLGKQIGIQPDGWRTAAGHYGEDGAFRSIADIADEASLGKVRAYKQEVKAAAKAARKPAALS
jgi:uncharacterized HhH-GPD family protein